LTDTSVKKGEASPMPKIVDRQKKAEAIGRAALKTFRKAGYHSTRMADIAEAAGIGKGTIYEYFKDKADVLRFVFEDYFNAFRDGAVGAMQEVESPAARLLALVEFAFEHVAEWQDHCAVYVDYFGAARVADRKLFSLGDIYADMGALLRGLIEQGQSAGEIAADVDAEATSELLLSLFDGIVLHGILVGKDGGPGALRRPALLLLTQGLLSAPKASRTRSRAGKKSC
jgi:AcrR family transcriptional regulator